MDSEKIILHAPYLTWNEDGSLCRYNVEITENGKEYRYFAEVEKEYAQYLCTELLDGILVMALPRAFRLGYDIYCDIPVTENLLYNINEKLLPALKMGNPNIKSSLMVHAPINKEKTGGNGVGAPVSCGVDSLYTIMKHTEKNCPADLQLTHLFITSINVELWSKNPANLNEWEKGHTEAFDRFYAVSEMTGLPLVKMFSNLHLYPMFDLKVRQSRVITYIYMGCVLILKKLFGKYISPNTYNFTDFNIIDDFDIDTSHYELFFSTVMNVSDFQMIVQGAETDRVDKTIELVDYEIARKTLHPCHRLGLKNCTRPGCDKCLRALLALDYYDKLEEMSEVFDVERYRKNHQAYLDNLIHQMHNEALPFYRRLYGMMEEKYPEKIKAAENHYEKSKAPISPEAYRSILDAYNALLKLSALPDLRKFINDFLKNRNIKKLYLSSFSRLGNLIKSHIDDSVQCVSQLEAVPEDCDATLILRYEQAKIRRITNILKNKGAKTIYSINDIIAAIDSDAGTQPLPTGVFNVACRDGENIIKKGESEKINNGNF